MPDFSLPQHFSAVRAISKYNVKSCAMLRWSIAQLSLGTADRRRAQRKALTRRARRGKNAEAFLNLFSPVLQSETSFIQIYIFELDFSCIFSNLRDIDRQSSRRHWLIKGSAQSHCYIKIERSVPLCVMRTSVRLICAKNRIYVFIAGRIIRQMQAEKFRKNIRAKPESLSSQA